MVQKNEFWKLDHLSHSQLLESLRDVIRSQRQALAELIAHLGEVEERRLHLEAAHSSMFDYCVARLGMSEDEACRRIDLARLARRFPALFPLLASGELTLSVALVLKPILSQANLDELLAAARGKSIREARELLALHAPRPDAPSSIRKLPERHTVGQGDPRWGLSPSASDLPPPQPLPQLEAPHAPVENQRAAPAPVPSPVAAQFHHPSRIEPLSPQRYKVQFTADKAVKEQLEQARDLLRHAIPSGDFGAIIARALELLIADLLRRRFGAGARRKAASTPARLTAAQQASTTPTLSEAPVSCAAAPALAAPAASPPSGGAPPSAPHVPRAARRAVLERDGLACTWRDADGKHCGARAWLEIDHCHPRAKGGHSQPDNLRILCRAHNHFAAEREYGRAHVERATSRRVHRRTVHTKDPPIATPPPI
jgi:hypothetical protein